MNMNQTSRNFLKDVKTSRTSSRYYGQPPQSGRIMNQNVFQDQPLKNTYSTRQSQQGLGIFTNQLNRKAGRMKEERELPIEFTQVLDYQNGKVRSSKKINQFSKQSRDQYSQNYQQNYEFYTYQQKEKDDLKKELAYMRQEIESSILDRVKKMMNDQASKVKQSISDILVQTNNAFRKKQETLYLLKTETYTLKEQVGKLAKSYLNFFQENEEKFENLHAELANLGGVKRSKAGQYNMDLKTSLQGLNASLNGNLANENQSSKLVNQVIFQIDNIKKQLAQNKAHAQQINFELSSKILELRNGKNEKNTTTSDILSVKYEQISKLVRQMLKQDRKSSKVQQKLQRFQSELFNIDFRIKNHEETIQAMNSEVASIVNVQINPKLKKFEASFVDLFSRIDKAELEKTINQKIAEDFSQRLKDTRLLKVRNCSKQEQRKLSVVSGLNQSKISHKQTYLLDEENYLLDSEGSYLVQQLNGRKERIKVESDQLYLLQLKGIQIQTAVG